MPAAQTRQIAQDMPPDLGGGNLRPITRLPDWLPEPVRFYLDHVQGGVPLRALARREGCNASTVLRQVRKLESRRDDPLMDEGLGGLEALCQANLPPARLDQPKEKTIMSAHLRPQSLNMDEAEIQREGKRVLRRLAESAALLAIAPDMEKAVVLREFPDGRVARTAVVDRPFAQAFALKDWIAVKKAGKVTSYEITSGGRAALKRMLADEAASQGLAEAPMAFARPGTAAAAATVGPREAEDDVGARRRMRYTATESAVAVLGRRRDKDGKLFMEPELVGAAERLREDFELAQMGPRTTQNWEGFLTGGIDRGQYSAEALRIGGASAARDRVALALRDLGPGLGDVVLRVCCYLEGIETAEQRMGWAARSGKIVLRIALQRLARHYAETYGRGGPLIG